MCPKALKIFQMRFNSLPNIKSTRKQLPKTFKMLPLWRNFTISGHTDRNSLFVIPLFHLFLSFSLFHVQLRSSLVNKTTQKIVDKLFSKVLAFLQQYCLNYFFFLHFSLASCLSPNRAVNDKSINILNSKF